MFAAVPMVRALFRRSDCGDGRSAPVTAVCSHSALRIAVSQLWSAGNVRSVASAVCRPGHFRKIATPTYERNRTSRETMVNLLVYEWVLAERAKRNCLAAREVLGKCRSR